jgi:hypothetical protein
LNFPRSKKKKKKKKIAPQEYHTLASLLCADWRVVRRDVLERYESAMRGER